MNRRLLIVDDQNDVARTLARALRSRGFDVAVAHDCAQALKFEEQVDCAVLDVDLPDGSGLDLAHSLLGKCTRAVVFFSGCADADVRQNAAPLGRFVPKSAGLEDLVSHIQNAIRDVHHSVGPSGASSSFESPGAGPLSPSASATFETPTPKHDALPNTSHALRSPEETHPAKKKPS